MKVQQNNVNVIIYASRMVYSYLISIIEVIAL